MANKISHDSIITVLNNNGYAADEAERIYEACVIEEKKLTGEKEPAERKTTEYVVVINDPQHKLPKDLTGWIIKKVPAIKDKYCFAEHAPEDWGTLEVEQRLFQWGQEFAQSPKFKPLKFACMGDYMEYGNKTLAKEYGLNIITKQPVYICGVDPGFKCTQLDGIEITDNIDSLN